MATAAAAVHADDANPDGIEYFEKKIRPVLSETCFKCHSAQSEKLKGGLLLDTREGLLKGGDTGPAIFPGEPEKSLLVKAVSYQDPDLQMPPKQKLTDRQIADFTAWIRMGAPWSMSEKTSAQRVQKAALEISGKERAWWAFQPIRRPVVPIANRPSPIANQFANRKSQIANPIDAFILAELESKNLSTNPSATKRELLRRACFDLIGLPPTPERIALFEKDTSPDAYAKVLDHLLSLPQYGERWGRHWLDLVRFAQSNGYERDGEKPLAWRYRDYVIQAFNQDKPYDLFVKEQIAGDELPQPTPDSIIATGFQRLGVWDDEPDDKRMAVFEELDDILSTTGAAFLGLTIGCARCHDHKFDPVSQADYYQLLAFFHNVRPHENAKYTLDAASYAPLADPAKVKQWQTEQKEKLEPLEAQLAAAKTDAEKKPLQEQIKQVQEAPAPFEWALAVREKGIKPEPTHVLIRGNAAMPGPEVQPAFLTVLGGQKPQLRPLATDAQSCGRRLALAEWIASPQNPLTARVMVNRIWQHHFGQGIVKTTTDFGRAGMPPTHPRLLDWLAAEFIECGWSIKKMHKLIMLSHTYRQSSRAQNEQALAVDPGNELLWRQNLRRLEAESIRDSLVAISGQLNFKMGGRGFFPHLGGEVLAGQSRPGLDWEVSSDTEKSRRSVYTYLRRTMLVPMMENFDYSNTASPLGERPITTVAPQALMLLNDDYWQQQAAAFAGRVANEAGAKPEKQIRRAYQLALGRNPTKRDQQIASDYLQRHIKSFEAQRSRLTFHPEAPSSLSVEYMRQMQPAHFLSGPCEGWSYHRGSWSSAYEGIRTADRLRGPFALWEGQAFADGVIEAKLILQKASEFGGLLFRAKPAGDVHSGYDVLLDARQQRVILRRHAADVTTVAEALTSIPTAKPFPLRLEAVGPHIRIWVNGSEQPVIDVTDSKSIDEAGLIGVRTWGAPLSLDDLTIHLLQPKRDAAYEPIRVLPVQADARQRALQSFCLLMLNLNEVLYVD